jgi:cell division protein FtsL
MSAVTAPLRRPISRPLEVPRRSGQAERSASARPAARSTPRLRVIERPRRRRAAVLVAMIVVLAGGAVFGSVALNAMAADAAVEARALEARVADGERRYGHLVAEVAALEDPGRIRERALELGLAPAGPTRHLVVDRPLAADGAADAMPSTSAAADPIKSILSLEP